MNNFPKTVDLMGRINWDKKFNPYNCVICYKDRFRTEYKEIEFPKWDIEGADIPIHRIYQFKYNGKIFWDRNTKFFSMDLIKDSEVDSYPTLKMLKYDLKDKAWVESYPVDTIEGIQNTFTIMTWNILFDKYRENETRFENRLGSVTEMFAHIDADIVCFQEITPKIKQYLLKLKHMQQYYVTNVNNKDNDLLIVSKFPFVHVRAFRQSKMKYILRCTLKYKEDYFDIYNVHLTSDASDNCEEKRSVQLQTVNGYMQKNKTNFLIGDTNIEDEDLPHCCDMLDCWVSIHNAKEGNTYCPNENDWAKMISTRQHHRRYDRILYKVMNNLFSVTDISIIKDKYQNIHPSDHYPVLATFSPCDNDTNITSFTEYCNHTGVSIIPPYNVCKEIDKIRKQYDNKYSRWMPHLNILFGFVPINQLKMRKKDIQQVVNKYLPFHMEFDGINTFTNGDSCIVYLEPTNECKKILCNIQKELAINIFNTEIPYEPHLKLGYFKQKSNVTKLHTMYTNLSYSWIVEHLSVVYKLIDSVWDIDRFRQLYTCNIINISKSFSKEFLLGVLGTIPHMEITLVGSGGINLDMIDSDLDVVISSSLEWNHALNGIIKWSGNVYIIKSVKSLSNKWINKVKLTLINLQEIELIYMKSPSIKDARKSDLNVQSMGAYGQYLDREFIQNILDKNSEYLLMLKYTKKWAKKKKIYGHIYGFPCGIGWVIIALRVIIEFSPANVEEFKEKFVEFYSHYNFSIPIQLTSQIFAKKRISDELLCIIKPSTCENTMRNATPSTVGIFCSELANFKNDTPREKPNTVKKTLTIIYDDNDVIRDIIGLVNSKIYTIIIKLEESNVTVDPDNFWERGDGKGTWSVYLNKDTNMWKNIMIGLSNYVITELDISSEFYLI